VANINIGRKSGFIRRSGVMRRESLWFSGIDVSTALGANSASLTASLNAAALGLRPFTVVRTRGVLLLESDQTAAAERTSVSFGQAVVSDQAVAIGVTAVPTPVTDQGSDLWYVYESLVHSFVNNAMGPAYNFKEFDSKAMRKVEDGQDLATVIENARGLGCTFSQVFRTLIKLH